MNGQSIGEVNILTESLKLVKIPTDSVFLKSGGCRQSRKNLGSAAAMLPGKFLNSLKVE